MYNDIIIVSTVFVQLDDNFLCTTEIPTDNSLCADIKQLTN